MNATQMASMRMICGDGPWPDAANPSPSNGSSTYGNSLVDYCTKPDGVGGRCFLGRPDFRALDPSKAWPLYLAENATKACSSCACQLTLPDLNGQEGPFTFTGPRVNLGPLIDAVKRLKLTISANATALTPGLSPPPPAPIEPSTCPWNGRPCRSHRHCKGSKPSEGCGCNHDAGKVDPTTRRRVGICGALTSISPSNGP